MISWIRKFYSEHPQSFIFFLAFLYVLLAGLMIQLIIIPYILPADMTVGNGLLRGYDAGKFHRIAVDAANKIQTLGWTAWTLKPNMQIVSGIASVFYTLFFPQPWVMLPLHGLLHGLGCVFFYKTLVLLTRQSKNLILPVLLFTFFPSALLWNTQLHNDVYIIPEIMFYIYGWTYFSDLNRVFKIRNAIFSFLVLFVGCFLIWETRNYVSFILSILSIIIVVFLIIVNSPWIKNHTFSGRKYLYYVILLFSIFIITTPRLYFSTQKDITLFSDSNQNKVTYYKQPYLWQETKWLPEKVDKKIKEVARIREKFIRNWDYAGSQIDTHIEFHSIYDFVGYIPRAMQIAFFSPFPNTWFSSGYKSAGDFMRAESAFEMIIIYICLIGLPFAVYKTYKNKEFWILSFVSLTMLYIYTCTIPNIGSLYRFRYPFLMPLVCLGFWGILEFNLMKKSESSKVEPS